MSLLSLWFSPWFYHNIICVQSEPAVFYPKKGVFIFLPIKNLITCHSHRLYNYNINVICKVIEGYNNLSSFHKLKRDRSLLIWRSVLLTKTADNIPRAMRDKLILLLIFLGFK